LNLEIVAIIKNRKIYEITPPTDVDLVS